MANPLSVSIVTPSFNQGRFIETTIRSVLAQTGHDLQYIIVDGESTDETPQVLRRYANRIDRIVCEPDGGQSDAINKGFRLATGQIVAWINSDDYYFPQAVARAVEAFDRDPKLDVFYGNCVYTDQNGRFLRYFTEVRPFSRHVLLNYSNFIMQPTTFFRRSTLEHIGFLRNELHYTMDWNLWCRLAEADCKFHYEPLLIAANREYGTTKTRSGGRARHTEIFHHNRRHGTTLFPWAAFSFRIGDALKDFRGGGQRGWLYPSIRKGKRWLRKEPQNNLYGIEAHGTSLQNQFRISFPWYENGFEHVAVEVQLHHPYRSVGEATVQIRHANHSAQVRLWNNSSQRLVLPLRPTTTFNGVVDLAGQWYGGPGKLQLKGVKVH